MQRSESYLRLIAAVMFLAFGAYAAALIFQQSGDGTVTETAEYRSISDSFSVKGEAYRELTPVIEDSRGYIILAAEGEYLPGGSAVAVREENSEDYFAFCDYKLSRKTFASEEEAVEAIKNGSASERALAVMYLEGQALPEKAQKPDGIVCTPCAGIFTRNADGGYSIASDVNWYFSFESEKAEQLSKGQKLNLKISSGPETKAEVYSIDENRVTLIIRSCTDYIPTGKSCTAEISLDDCQGIKVPREALHFDGDGSPFVYVLSAGIKEKITVEIIYTSRSFYLCDDSALREGMEIIVSES